MDTIAERREKIESNSIKQINFDLLNNHQLTDKIVIHLGNRKSRVIPTVSITYDPSNPESLAIKTVDDEYSVENWKVLSSFINYNGKRKQNKSIQKGCFFILKYSWEDKVLSPKLGPVWGIEKLENETSGAK